MAIETLIGAGERREHGEDIQTVFGKVILLSIQIIMTTKQEKQQQQRNNT